MAIRDDDLRITLATMSEQLKNVQEDIDQIKHVLIDGNGRPPVVTTVAIHAEKLAKLEEKESDKKIPRAVWVGMLLSIILSIVGFFYGSSSHETQSVVETSSGK